jgi:hypothetical protein
VANYDSDACIVIDNPCPGSPVLVTSDNLVDFWVKMSNVFVNDPTVIAYDLTNEPHDMGVANWSQIAQKVLTAIRANGDNKTIMIPGRRVEQRDLLGPLITATRPSSPTPPTTTTMKPIEYFDSDFSGSLCGDLRPGTGRQSAYWPTVGVTRLIAVRELVQCQQRPLLSRRVRHTQQRCAMADRAEQLPEYAWIIAGMPGTYWAAGELWATVPTCSCSLLSVQPSNNFTTDAEQLPTLLGHLPPNTVPDGFGGRFLRMG